MARLYTIGHSTRPLEDLFEALQAHEIKTLVDIRAFPMSRRLPQFDRESLEATSLTAGVRYVWMKALGGYRKNIRQDSPNISLRNASFRNYADYMLTEEFEAAMAELTAMAKESRTAYMCAERLYFRCHRMLVSDWLVAHEHEVMHVDSVAPAKLHRLTAEARIIDGKLIYSGDRLF